MTKLTPEQFRSAYVKLLAQGEVERAECIRGFLPKGTFDASRPTVRETLRAKTRSRRSAMRVVGAIATPIGALGLPLALQAYDNEASKALLSWLLGGGLALFMFGTIEERLLEIKAALQAAALHDDGVRKV